MKTKTTPIVALVGASLCLFPGSLIAGGGADAPLYAGIPVTIGSPQTFSGVGGTNTSTTAGTANAALMAFEAAIGGANNGANPPPQATGFRTINWDGVALDGTDFGGNSIVISLNNVVGIPVNRFEERGVIFEEIYAVSGPASGGDTSTFFTVNPTVTNLFPAFSPTKTFAMFNDNTIDMSFNLATIHTQVPKPAATRGFGAIFRNVEIANSTSIEYFNDSQSLGKFFVPAGSQGQAEFLGVLFANPIVTGVRITCGTDVLFSFNGATFSSSSSDNPAGGHNLVVTDDFVYAEPALATNTQPTINATAGTPFNGPVATFRDADTGATANNFSATIQWGDGHLSPGSIAGNASSGFTVSSSNTFAVAGTYGVRTEVTDFQGSSVTLHNLATVAGPGIVTNISTRATVGTGSNVLIAGFIVGGNNSVHAVVRALGPTLTSFGVSGALQDPILEIHDGSGTLIASNDNWKDTQQAVIQATGLAPPDDRESAILTTFALGNFTAIVRGKNNTTGVGLIEVYNIP